MGDLAIRVDGLGKRYRIGLARQRRDTLRDTVMERLGTIRLRGRTERNGDDTFWALKDVSFDVKRGEVIGIIGRNGAGKSTLLKILSRITRPTLGHAEIHGRVGSLLEVGTGFHPELTGRENVYLNGAILGMKRAEIERRFDEIIAFAEIEKFLDTPVKRYSSGMYVRLAFAVAAHLEPEILLVDEVLAVGDAAFQEKCLGRMQKSASDGKTVIFVSHNLASIQQLCARAFLVNSGRFVAEGLPSDVVSLYLSDALNGASISITDWSNRATTGQARLTRIDISNEKGFLTNRVPFGGTVCFTLHAEFHEALTDPSFGVLVHDAGAEPILDVRSIHDGLRLGKTKGEVVVQVIIKRLALYPGRYLLSPVIMNAACDQIIDFAKLCCVLDVDPAPGSSGDLKLDPIWGKYWVPSEWAATRVASMT